MSRRNFFDLTIARTLDSLGPFGGCARCLSEPPSASLVLRWRLDEHCDVADMDRVSTESCGQSFPRLQTCKKRL